MRHLISLKDLSKAEMLQIIDLAQDMKQKRAQGRETHWLKNKTLIMFFQKTSTRTRLSYETAMTELGGHAIFLDARTTQFGLSEFVDEIQAVMRFGHFLMFRAKKAYDVLRAAHFNQIPVIDGCSEKYHPSQALADLLTMAEQAGGVDKIKKVVWLGAENNVSNTLKLVCAKMGIRIVLVAPETDASSVDDELNQLAGDTGVVEKTLDLEQALKGADFVHTDTWLNMEFFDEGDVKPELKDEFERRKQIYLPYQLNAEIIDKYAPQSKIMHCMPCHVGYEITRDAIDHPNSVIYDQAENRLHAQKAMLLWLNEQCTS